MADEEYPVWNQFRGTLDYTEVGEIHKGKYGRNARLKGPLASQMGVFNFDELLQKGRAESQGYTSERWQSDRESAIREYSKRNFAKGDPFESASDPKEDEYRRLLRLLTAGALLKSEIEQAFRMAAKRTHPDARVDRVRI